jgi:hypothetical protein
VSSIRELFELYFDNEEELWQDMDKAIHIQEGQIPQQQQQQAELYLHWARLHALAEAEVAKQEEFISHYVWPMAKERAAKALGEKRQTQAAIESLIHADPEYQHESEERRKLRDLARYLAKMENAMFIRKDMLQSIGARQRVELENTPNVENVRAMLREKYGRHEGKVE